MCRRATRYTRRTALLTLPSGTYLLAGVPRIVMDLVDWLTAHGLAHEGLFRVPARAVAIAGLLRSYQDREGDEDRTAALLAGVLLLLLLLLLLLWLRLLLWLLLCLLLCLLLWWFVVEF